MFLLVCKFAGMLKFLARIQAWVCYQEKPNKTIIIFVWSQHDGANIEL